jgi:hypothetical protein
MPPKKSNLIIIFGSLKNSDIDGLFLGVVNCHLVTENIHFCCPNHFRFNFEICVVPNRFFSKVNLIFKFSVSRPKKIKAVVAGFYCRRQVAIWSDNNFRVCGYNLYFYANSVQENSANFEFQREMFMIELSILLK